MSERPYLRLYYIDLERDYPDVWHDDLLLATFARLLAVAEAMWPARPEVPRSACDAAVERLVDYGLVIKTGPYAFCIKGMDAERTTRSNAARIAAAARWSDANAMPNQTEPRPNQTEPKAETPLGRVIDAYLLARHRLPTERQRQVIARYLEVFEVSGEQRAIQLILGHPADPVGALIADMDAEMTKRKAAAIEGEAEAKRSKARYGLSGVNAELYAALQAREEGAA